MNWLSCLKWDPCEMQERRAKGVFRTKHPHRPTPFLNQCPTEISLSSFKLYCPAAMFKCIRTPFNLKSACVKAIWDLFPQNERQVTKIHFQDMTRFKMVYYMSWLLPYLRSKTIFTLSNSFVFYWFLKCSMSHTSFSSLATCRSFCDNRSHMLLFKSKNKHIKKTFHCCRCHNLPFLSTIIPSTSPQLSTDIRALWSTDALVWFLDSNQIKVMLLSFTF